MSARELHTYIEHPIPSTSTIIEHAVHRNSLDVRETR